MPSKSTTSKLKQECETKNHEFVFTPSQSNKCPGCGIEIPSHRQLCGMNGMVCDMDYTTDRYGNIYDINVNEQ